MLFVISQDETQVLRCILRSYKDPRFIDCIETDELYEGSLCIKSMISFCFQKYNVKNELDPSVNDGVEMFEYDPRNASACLLMEPSPIGSQKDIVWLGNLAWSGNWKHYPYPENSFLNKISNNVQLRKDPYYDFQCKKPKCHTYSKDIKPMDLIDPEKKMNRTFDTGIEDVSCTPSVFLAGFMKSASTFLFKHLEKHPNILPAIVGSQYKETRCHAFSKMKKDKLLSRAWCFPFISKKDNFISIDGTIFNALDPNVPFVMLDVRL